MKPGIRIAIHGETVTLEIGTDSDHARRELGAATWSVLEMLALTGSDMDGRWIATTNARDLAARLGIGKDRAAVALSALREAGLVVAHTTRDSTTARFGRSRYEVRLPVFRGSDTRELASTAARSVEPRTRARVRDTSSAESLDLFSSVE